MLIVAPTRDLVIAHRVEVERTRRVLTSEQIGPILGGILEAMPA